MAEVWGLIKANVSDASEGICEAVSSAFSSMWSGIKNTVSNIYTSIKEGFDKAVGIVKELASYAYDWGSDIINNIVKGIKASLGNVKDAVSGVAKTIRSYLHFSVPDVGPLTDFESWMPDFMKGLAEGIEKSRYLVERAINGVSASMVVNPYSSRFTSTGMDTSSSSFDVKGFANELKNVFQGATGSSGDIVIPVYLGGTMLDEFIVDAQKRTNLRSGGR